MIEATSIVTGLAGRYATALYELARDQGSLPAVERDLQSLKRAIDDSADLRRLIRSPLFSQDVQGKAIEAVATRMQLSPLTQRFLGVLARNRRLFALRDIAEDFIKLAAYFRGEIAANVTSAQPLSGGQLDRLKNALKAALGRTVTLSESINPDLLGGLIVRVGSRMVDSSIRTQLSNLQVAMREVN